VAAPHPWGGSRINHGCGARRCSVRTAAWNRLSSLFEARRVATLAAPINRNENLPSLVAYVPWCSLILPRFICCWFGYYDVCVTH